MQQQITWCIALQHPSLPGAMSDECQFAWLLFEKFHLFFFRLQLCYADGSQAELAH